MTNIIHVKIGQVSDVVHEALQYEDASAITACGINDWTSGNPLANFATISGFSIITCKRCLVSTKDFSSRVFNETDTLTEMVK